MKFNIVKIAVILIIIFAVSNTKSYAYYNLNFRNITNEDGLSQGTVETIIQDKEGYMWIGTNDGLNKYNGYNFEVYKHDKKSSNTISNNYIVDLQQDKYGNIWVGTANGLNKIDPTTNKITNYYKGKDKGNLSHNNIGDILITKNGDVLIGTSNGLNIYNKKNDRFEHILNKEGNLTNQYIYSLEEDIDGNIWIGTQNGLNKIDIKSNKIEKFNKNEENTSISSNKIYELYSDIKGYIWVGTFDNGLSRIDIKTGEVKQFINDEDNENSISGNMVRDILRDKNGILWIATDRGLCRYDEENDIFKIYKNKVYDNNTLVNDEVFSLIEDYSGLIWAGTYSGISIFDANNRIEHYKNDPFDNDTLSENVVHGIYEDTDGFVWIGTSSKGLNILNRKNGKVKNITEKSTNNALSDDNINVIAGKGNEIYIGTNDGLNIINKDKKSIIYYKKEDGLVENKIMALFIDNSGYLWIGTPTGISILNVDTGDIINLSNELKKDYLNGFYVREIYQDKYGTYWIGSFTDGGLLKIDPNDKTIKSYKSSSSDINTISSDTVRTIKEDELGNLWIGTSYGLNKFNRKTEEFVRYSMEDGLPNDVIYGILIDEENNPWMSTNLGISKLDIKTNDFKNFGKLDGLQGNEFNGCAYYKNSIGEFFFGGLNGLNIFRPSDIEKDSYTPKVRFDRFDVNGKFYNNIDNRTFKHNENFINISISIPDYRNMESIQYKYILEGATDSWYYTESNDLNFSNLAPGKYKLKIQARGHTGVISDEVSIRFMILQPLLKSKTAILIYIIIAILIIYVYINRMKHLDILVKIRTKELSNEMEKNNNLLNKVIKLERNKNNYFVNLSHELRTPLNVIHTTEQLITEFNESQNGISKEKIDYYMSVMNRNTKRLLNLINNIVDTTKIESGNYKISLKENDIIYIVEEAALSLKEYIESKGINLIIDPEIEEKIIMCDEYEIERCIVNLVSNAAKFTPEGGKIEVTIKEEDNHVIISVEDNGIGIDPKYHSSIFNRFNQVLDDNLEVKGGSGLGLTITKHIIELHGGEINVESRLNEGSKFIIKL